MNSVLTSKGVFYRRGEKFVQYVKLLSYVHVFILYSFFKVTLCTSLDIKLQFDTTFDKTISWKFIDQTFYQVMKHKSLKWKNV